MIYTPLSIRTTEHLAYEKGNCGAAILIESFYGDTILGSALCR